MRRTDLLERLATDASSPSVAAFLRREADKVRDGVSGEGNLTRVDSEAFLTPELDAAVAASLCPPRGVVATLPPGWMTSAECEAAARLVDGSRRERLLKRAAWIRRVCAEAEAKLTPP